MLVQVDWDVVRYNDRLSARPTGQNEAIEAGLMAFARPAYQPPMIVTDPMVVLDCHRRIMCWYLPDLMSKEWQVGHQML